MNSTDSLSPLIGQSTRRSFLGKAFGLGVGAAALPAALTMAPQSARADEASLAQDLEVLTLALNLEYLEAEFYSYAVYGVGIDQTGAGIDGTTPAGTTIIKSNPKANFTSAEIFQYATEIAQDEINHVNALRSLFVSAGVTPPSRPNIDLLNSFNTLSAAAGIGASFDPFVGQFNFLLGAFIFEDVGVTAYHGGAPLITDPNYLSAAAGILAVEGFHAALVRVNIVQQGTVAIQNAGKISDLRDSLDGSSDKDQGLIDSRGLQNIVPADQNATVFSRNRRKVLNIVYGAIDAPSGLFFPNGINL